MIRPLFRPAFFAMLAVPLAMAAHAADSNKNYYVHYECAPEKNYVAVKTYMADMHPINRPRDDMMFDALAGNQRIFECTLASGDTVFFRTVYGSPKEKYGHIAINVNNAPIDQTIEFNPDHTETLQISNEGDHKINVNYLNGFAMDTSPHALAAMETAAQEEDAKAVKELHEENVKAASLRPPGVYGWGVLYTQFKESVPPGRDHKEVGAYNWGVNGQGFKDEVSGNGMGPYAWGVLYVNYKEHDPQYGAGPWGWGPATIGSGGK